MPGATKETVSVRVKDGSVLFAVKLRWILIRWRVAGPYDGSFGPFDMSKLGDIKAEVNYGVLKMLINYRK
ncbi:hypothetical protein CFP56_043560 [Quercus suber]|uniref:Uncharacterized protein n=1 Tax=Quercus suber TaxID=58331 RepID=A0AAW0IQP5_QUESU